MISWVALLRAVNVAGTGKLPMATLREMASGLRLADVRTYIASGNLLFRSAESEQSLKQRLEERLTAFAGKPVPVFLRDAAALAKIEAANPFPDAHGSRHLVYFSHAPLDPGFLEQVRGQQGERIDLHAREVHVDYGDGIRHTKLKLPGEKQLTARNINTVRRLVAMLRG